jgi:nucleotide-binding universal stress UspA family protein
MLRIRNILFPCDLTENSGKIFYYALSLMEKYDSTLILLHVVENLRQWGDLYVPATAIQLDQKIIEKEAVRALEEFYASHVHGVSDVRREVLSGDPVTVILNVIENEDVDLVILGTHGRKGLEHTVFGSVAENVVRRSPVPVLTINPYTLKSSP